MCIIAYKPKKVTITKRILRNCWDFNPDGAGFMFAVAGKLHIHKGFMSFKTFYKALRKYENQHNENFVLHFRIATAGKINSENCHPFAVSKDIGFVHNGILNCVDVPAKSHRSDTVIFCKTILQKLPQNFLSRKKYHILLETIAKAENSKFVFLTNTGTAHIFNEKAGVWQNEIWYSNNVFENTKQFGFAKNQIERVFADDYSHIIANYEYKNGSDYIECVWCGDYIPYDFSYQEPCCDLCAKELDKIN